MLKLNIMLVTRGFKKRKITNSKLDIWYRKDAVVVRDRAINNSTYITFHHLEHGIITSTVSYKLDDPAIHTTIDKLGKEVPNVKGNKEAN